MNREKREYKRGEKSSFSLINRRERGGQKIRWERNKKEN